MRSNPSPALLVLVVALPCLGACSSGSGAAPAAGGTRWPGRILVTNDNGIDDTGMIELARALAGVAETHVVAADRDRSGTSNLMSGARRGEFRVQRRDLGVGIEAWALDGYPADCVLFALAGPLRDRPPDLVVSGINGGPNLGDDWFGSGTIGAARTAAYLGIPSVAVSGLEDDDPDAVRAAVRWVVELVQSDAVRALRAPQYLTVSLPQVHPAEVAGVEVVTRARGVITGLARPLPGHADDTYQTWRLELTPRPETAPEASDVAANGRRSIAVVPMRVDESDPQMLAWLRGTAGLLPEWSSAPASPADDGSCRSGLGVAIDDAEDESGREWGVIIEEVLAGGRAEELGLRAGDVLVSLNGLSLAVERTSREDPDARFLRLLRALDCGDTVTLEYVRGSERAQTAFRIPDRPE